MKLFLITSFGFVIFVFVCSFFIKGEKNIPDNCINVTIINNTKEDIKKVYYFVGDIEQINNDCLFYSILCCFHINKWESNTVMITNNNLKFLKFRIVYYDNHCQYINYVIGSSEKQVVIEILERE